MARDKMEPLLFMAWVRHTMMMTFEDDLGFLFRDWLQDPRQGARASA
jgi:penicillin amidase